MKISELIEKLQEIQKEKGDLYVDVLGHNVHDVQFNIFMNTVSIEL